MTSVADVTTTPRMAQSVTRTVSEKMLDHTTVRRLLLYRVKSQTLRASVALGPMALWGGWCQRRRREANVRARSVCIQP